MIDAGRMRGGEPAAQLSHHRDRPLDRQCAARDHRAQPLAIDALVRQHDATVRLDPRTAHRRDEWRLDARECAGDALEIVQRVGLATDLTPQHVHDRRRLARGILEQLTERVGPKRAPLGARRRAHGRFRRQYAGGGQPGARPRALPSTRIGNILSALALRVDLDGHSSTITQVSAMITGSATSIEHEWTRSGRSECELPNSSSWRVRARARA